MGWLTTWALPPALMPCPSSLSHHYSLVGASHRPHPCIGRARRMMVRDRAAQHSVLLEAVQNHTPHAVVVDEIGTPQVRGRGLGGRGRDKREGGGKGPGKQRESTSERS